MTEDNALAERKAALQHRALLLAAAEKLIAKEVKANKVRLEAVMTPGQTDRPKLAVGEDRHPMQAGTVAYAEPELPDKVWVETDRDAHVAWADQHHPTEVEIITQVRPAFTATYTIVGDKVLDSDAVVVEGLEVRQPAPRSTYIAVTPAKDPAVLAELWAMIRNSPAEILPVADDE